MSASPQSDDVDPKAIQEYRLGVMERQNRFHQVMKRRHYNLPQYQGDEIENPTKEQVEEYFQNLLEDAKAIDALDEREMSKLIPRLVLRNGRRVVERPTGPPHLIPEVVSLTGHTRPSLQVQPIEGTGKHDLNINGYPISKNAWFATQIKQRKFT